MALLVPDEGDRPIGMAPPSYHPTILPSGILSRCRELLLSVLLLAGPQQFPSHLKRGHVWSPLELLTSSLPSLPDIPLVVLETLLPWMETFPKQNKNSQVSQPLCISQLFLPTGELSRRQGMFSCALRGLFLTIAQLWGVCLRAKSLQQVNTEGSSGIQLRLF